MPTGKPAARVVLDMTKTAELKVERRTPPPAQPSAQATGINAVSAALPTLPGRGRATPQEEASLELSPECRQYLEVQLPARLDMLTPTQRDIIFFDLASQGAYEIGDFLARGAECVLYQGRAHDCAFCVKCIRNWKDKWLGDARTRGEAGKLQSVSYATKVRHLTNEYKVGKMLAENDASRQRAVRIFSLRRRTRFGLELGWDLLMERINGIDLSSQGLLNALSTADKVRVCLQICQAIGMLHQRHLVHLDIKPSNFMLDRNGRVRLIDFGISVPEGFRSKAIAGTAGYFSPEQICRAPLNVATDIFALGVTFSILFGGHTLAQSAEEALNHSFRVEAAEALEKNSMPAVTDVPDLVNYKPLADVIRACTIYRPDLRIPSCIALANRLRAAAVSCNIPL